MPKAKNDIQDMSINDPQQNISVKITFYLNILKQSILDFFWELSTSTNLLHYRTRFTAWLTRVYMFTFTSRGSVRGSARSGTRTFREVYTDGQRELDEICRELLIIPYIEENLQTLKILGRTNRKDGRKLLIKNGSNLHTNRTSKKM